MRLIAPWGSLFYESAGCMASPASRALKIHEKGFRECWFQHPASIISNNEEVERP
jgi:hypothetical protein